jgi:hypothetical protein
MGWGNSIAWSTSKSDPTGRRDQLGHPPPPKHRPARSLPPHLKVRIPSDRPCGRRAHAAGSFPYRQQPVRRHLEFRGAFLDGSGLVGGLYGAEPNAGEIVDAPPNRLRRFGLLCHAGKYRPAGKYLQRLTEPCRSSSLTRTGTAWGEMRKHTPRNKSTPAATARSGDGKPVAQSRLA